MFRTHRKKTTKFVTSLEDLKKWKETLCFALVCLLGTCKAVGFEWGSEQHNLVPLMNVDAKILSRTVSNEV